MIVEEMIPPIIDKIILTVTNFAAIPAIVATVLNPQYLKTFTLFLASMTSTIHHANEIRFYSPALLNFSEITQFTLLQLDRLNAASSMITVCGPDYLAKHWLRVVILFAAMLMSDLVFYISFLSFDIKRFLRVVLHSYWHVGIFYEAYVMVTQFATMETFWDIGLRILFG